MFRRDCLIDLLVYHYLLGSAQFQPQVTPRRTRRQCFRTGNEGKIDNVQRIVTHENLHDHVGVLIEILQTDWEREVEVIERTIILESGEPTAMVKMKCGKRYLLSTEWLALHCPRKMLRFREREGKL